MKYLCKLRTFFLFICIVHICVQILSDINQLSTFILVNVVYRFLMCAWINNFTPNLLKGFYLNVDNLYKLHCSLFMLRKKLTTEKYSEISVIQYNFQVTYSIYSVPFFYTLRWRRIYKMRFITFLNERYLNYLFWVCCLSKIRNQNINQVHLHEAK